ncbi:tRNA (adenosine(37)-N6)-threonylcarbamoyltransferase complex dimerization subunit type 1 TsaB [Tissierella pigra]|uniref:tRNA (Adenosine(37)-N6)-threonylcarbamoyltransferase complex dimerization subunit type 1 TsaB n=1 Tax=Tissierella pigra TaxID=2607614 RepID=A0A6N7XNE2_9FIRM|nr:tRNA (adenosine(37)-N6)-threonylcarbamoyltransferase complex dimerization subunit type 1 TsaB [Tissierella pigra]MBU5427740.1 tRNA (adenosine(37)-N6)-threonylcarbamoyltransferase complex dimerization subunit type 1 TsaB [Tissierella pigra]MSU03026.1 tRNA (adenosine(37)-N6)-threonylcarbamoyltransferase complex dimerization subunit type 1 TsaB [Tissierella pigra]
MKILALDTSTMMATCAVLDENRILGEYSLNQEETHSEKLVPMVKELLDSLGLNVSDIDLYGVALGPGSFTGLRIGVATIKAFAHLFNKPVVGVSTLEGLAFNLPYNEIIVPMIDARRDRVYTGIYTWEESNIKTVMEPDVLDINDLLDVLGKYDRLIVNGDGGLLHRDIIKEKLGKKVQFSTNGQNFCRATSIGELALKKYNEGKIDDFYTLVPEYLRESQAQRELKEREGR